MRTPSEILKDKIKEKFGDTELINKYVYDQCVIAGVLEAMWECRNMGQDPDVDFDNANTNLTKLGHE